MLGAVSRAETAVTKGKIDKIVGMVIESTGPNADIGSVCRIYNSKNTSYIKAEVVGFKDNKVLLMPYGGLGGITKGSVVESSGEVLEIPVCDGLVGRVIDGLATLSTAKAKSPRLPLTPWKANPKTPLPAR